ncbi:MAG: hypothetical protein ABIN94_11510 [Ferruginibacter sp.]
MQSTFYEIVLRIKYFNLINNIAFKRNSEHSRAVNTEESASQQIDNIKKLFMKENKRLTGILIIVAIILLIPLIAMQFSSEVNWSVFDFVVAGVLLLGTGLLCELVIRKVNKVEHRVALCIAVLTALILVWLELAVGIFGTPFAGS